MKNKKKPEPDPGYVNWKEPGLGGPINSGNVVKIPTSDPPKAYKSEKGVLKERGTGRS